MIKPIIKLTVTDKGQFIAKLMYETPVIYYPLRNGDHEELEHSVSQLKIALIQEILNSKIEGL